MLIPSVDHSLDELRDRAEQNGFPRNVVKAYSMIVYDIPDAAFHGVRRRGKTSKATSGSDQGVTDGD